MHKVALIRGDGIGPEISEATQRVIEAAGVAVHWEEAPMGGEGRRLRGADIPRESLETVRRLGVALKGPLIAKCRSGGVTVEDNGVVRRHPSINNGIRRELGAYANLRPVRGFEGVSGRYSALDIVIVREVTEDTYAGIERQVDADTAEAVKLITRAASTRIARFACEHAVRHQRAKITAVHKANVLHLTDGLFLESVRAVVAQYPGLVFDDRMVDAACYLLVKSPEQFDVLVLPNQYGDILSDVAAGLVGSLGLAPGANIGPQAAVFEAAHGAAPDISGQDLANPIGLILSGALLLDHLGEHEAARRVRRAVATVLREGRSLTPDLGGSGSARALTGAICAATES
ncbi:MAG: isocitrate/isopropylmalate family dehydrogenase [Acidobacteriota bacterium]